MALLALHLASYDMLCMIEIGMIRKIVNLDPFNWLSGFNRTVYLGDFRSPRIPAASHGSMAIHAKVDRRNAGMLAYG